MHTRIQAEQYAALIRRFAIKERLLKVYLFGSISHFGYGHDLDIIVEVPEPVFLDFASKCIGALDGYHPIKKAMLPLASAYWDYESPTLDRFRNALSVVGITSEDALCQLRQCVPDSSVDMLCLPAGWKDPGYADGLLAKAFGFQKDPNMLRNITASAIVA